MLFITKVHLKMSLISKGSAICQYPLIPQCVKIDYHYGNLTALPIPLVDIDYHLVNHDYQSQWTKNVHHEMKLRVYWVKIKYSTDISDLFIGKISSAYKIWLYQYRPQNTSFSPYFFQYIDIFIHFKVIDHSVLLLYVKNFKIQITELNAGNITMPIFSLFLAQNNYDRSLVGVMPSLYCIMKFNSWYVSLYWPRMIYQVLNQFDITIISKHNIYIYIYLAWDL